MRPEALGNNIYRTMNPSRDQWKESGGIEESRGERDASGESEAAVYTIVRFPEPLKFET